MASYIGVDIGGTKIHSALVSDNGRILKERFLKTETGKGRTKVLANIIESINSVLRKDCKGIGIGSPGPLDIAKGKILHTPNLPLTNVNLKQILQKKFRLPVKVDNDANCFVLGEAMLGTGKGKKVVAGFTMGTGIGGGIVIDGKIFHGQNSAGEFGHMIINLDGKKGRCGHVGCLESFIGKHAIRDAAKKLHAKNPYELYMLAKKGNKKAMAIWADVGDYLGIGIANICNTIHPDMIVIGGNVSGAWKFFEKNMKKTARETAIVKVPPIVKSKLGSSAAVLGAASLVLDK